MGKSLHNENSDKELQNNDEQPLIKENDRIPIQETQKVDKAPEAALPKSGEKLILVEVEFKGNRKAYYWCEPNEPYQPGDHVIVEAERGEDVGVVSLKCLNVEKHKNSFPRRRFRVLRTAVREDLSKRDLNRRDEEAALRTCRSRIVARGLRMKLVDAEYQLDRNKITFYFTAQKRVDFRELVKDLAGIFKTRIEMRQIGVRDEARWLKGYGSCGRPLCCASFIHKFEPITLKMAKDQFLSLNPTKLSGVCGRLMCCLSYEREFYCREVNEFPALGMKVVFAGKRGRVSKYNIFKRLVYIQFMDGSEQKFPLEKMHREIMPAGEAERSEVDRKNENIDSSGGTSADTTDLS